MVRRIGLKRPAAVNLAFFASYLPLSILLGGSFPIIGRGQPAQSSHDPQRKIQQKGVGLNPPPCLLEQKLEVSDWVIAASTIMALEIFKKKSRLRVS
jgi:hypothetical protein